MFSHLGIYNKFYFTYLKILRNILFMDKPLLHPLWTYSHNELSTLTKEQNK